MGAFDVIPNIIIPDPDNAEEAAAFRKKWGWEAHEQVIISGKFTTEMQEEMENAGSAFKGAGRKQVTDLRLGTARRKLLEVMIRDWTFTENGRKVPVSPRTIGMLPPSYRKPILEVCDSIAQLADEEEQEAFLPSANGHSPENSDPESLSLLPS